MAELEPESFCWWLHILSEYLDFKSPATFVTGLEQSVWLDLFVDGISTFVGYLMLNPSL